MAGRPPLVVGTHGTIRVRDVTPEGRKARTFRAWTYYRDIDGRSRLVSRSGASEARAERALKKALVDRNTGNGGTSITRDSKIAVVAEKWFQTIEAAVAAGERSPNTSGLYRGLLDRHILPALGALRLSELSTGRLDPVLIAIKNRSGAATAKSCRTVVSGFLSYAARSDAVTTNAARNTSAIPTKPSRKPRALSAHECTRWLTQLCEDEDAVRKDLVDLTVYMLATGVRIGEALGTTWKEVDLEAGTVMIDWTVIRVKGKPLYRKSTKTTAGSRVLRLPSFAVEMLKTRPRRSTDAPVFPDSNGNWRDPSNTSRDLREARGSEEFQWVTSHVFRKTCATMLDDEGFTARQIADVLGHSRPSMTQDVYMGRTATDSKAAAALDRVLGEALNHA
jgi:integrase